MAELQPIERADLPGQPTTLAGVLVQNAEPDRYYLAAKWLLYGSQEQQANAYFARIAGLSSLTANLTGTGYMSSLIAGIGNVTGLLLQTGGMRVSIPGIGVLTGPLTGLGKLEAYVQGAATITGVLADPIRQLAAVLSGNTSFTGNLSATGLLTIIIPGLGTMTGTLGGDGTLHAILAGNASIVADLTMGGLSEEAKRRSYLGTPFSPTPTPGETDSAGGRRTQTGTFGGEEAP